MATLRVTSLRGRTAGTSPELPDGAVVTGVTTTGSAIVGAAVTINASGVDAGAGIITATSFVGNTHWFSNHNRWCSKSTDNIKCWNCCNLVVHYLQVCQQGSLNSNAVLFN